MPTWPPGLRQIRNLEALGECVETSIALARDQGALLALNLLTLPGETGRRGEVEKLAWLVVRCHVNQVQARSLAIDAATRTGTWT